MKIYLTGMPGCGKSTFGKRASAESGIRFLDLDKEISRREGCTINDIFELKGELFFRKLESMLLKSLTSEYDSFIMATGGGAPCFFENMDFMNSNGTTIYIQVSVNIIMDRLSRKGLSKRPLLKDLGPEELRLELSEKLKSRKIFYEKARHILPYNPDMEKDITNIINNSGSEKETET
ncbi:MAG TPA: shikimate kinase [Cyclobacteriaceae bacterium]|nr:shikimate kinase [Cyclobacteriaceae bacterium]